MNRINSGLPKEHFLDAASVSDCAIRVVSRIAQPFIAICKGQGGRQKAALNKYGYPIRHNQLKPIKGWSSGDLALRVDTREFGRVNPRSKSNSFNFTPFKGKAVSVHMDKLKRVHRKDGYIPMHFVKDCRGVFRKMPPRTHQLPSPTWLRSGQPH